MTDPTPLSTFYMEQVLEERPTKAFRLGPRIGARFFPIKAYSDYRIVWEEVREYSPMAGAYALEDLPDTMDELDFQTYQADVMHWGSRMTLSPAQIMFLRFAGQVNAVNAPTGYGTGPAADDYRRRDAEKIAKYTRMMNEGLDNVLEYLAMGALLGKIKWPPDDADGNAIAAADLPLSMGRQALNQPYAFLAASATDGGFHQSASTLTGVSGGVSATGVAWNASTANPIHDMSVIMDLLEDRMNLTTENLLILTARKVIAHIAKLTGVLDWILGENRDRVFLLDKEIRNFINLEVGWTVEYYQSKWEYIKQGDWDTTNPTVNQVPFMPYGTWMILPRPEIQEMGKMATAPAPGPAHNWQAGKYMWMERDAKPPWKTEMGMGGFWWPLMFDGDVRFRLDAWS